MTALEVTTMGALLALLILQEFLGAWCSDKANKLRALTVICTIPLLVLFGILIGQRLLVLLR